MAPEVNITLEPDSESLEAAVVSTGMTNIDKRLFTGASDRLEAEDMVLSGVADISRSLEGRAAGVTVQNVSSTFGTAPKIRVRGATSILGNSKPLWVVDGVIIEDVTEVNTDELSSGDAVTMVSSAIAGLNSDDIESINILKDGSATSIYGAKAMAGVIVVMITVLLSRGRLFLPIWLFLLLVTVAGGVFYGSVMLPYRAQERNKREFGAMIAAALARETPGRLYKSNILDLYGEIYYAGVGARKIQTLEELPADEPVVYLLSTEFPLFPDRNWTNLLAPGYTYRSHRLALWKGELRPREE